MQYNFFKYKKSRGFSLVELIIASAVFAVVAVAVYQAYSSLISLVSVARVKVTAMDLVNEQFELVRNLPYSQVGIVSGIPSGVLLHTEDIVRDGKTFTITRTIRNVDDSFDGTIGGTPNDSSPADFKVVDLEVACSACKNFSPLSVTTRVSPKNLETASTNGALFIKVFDASGQPVSDANVHIVNNKATTTITIDDVTDLSGMLQIVDAPPGVNAYHVTVSKTGYTSDQTYATSSGNPNPATPDATVLLQQVTQVSFVIDKVSTINISTISDSCDALGNVSLSMTGTRLIGTSPNVYKYNQTFSTNSGGSKSLSNIEWDSYNISINGGGYNLAGIDPLLPVQVLPNATQNMELVLTSKTPSLLLVTVKDNSTQLPISGAIVNLSDGSYNKTETTGLGYRIQTDWSGGPGQTDFIDQTKYDSSDGNVDTNNPTGEIKLSNVFGNYASSGVLTSSTFDTGTTSNFSQISWSPISESPEVGANAVRFHLATAVQNNASTTWTYLGPDGTAGTYYSTSNTNISSTHNGDRYFRYKAYLQTASTTFTPSVSDTAVTFTSGCIPPGQALFSAIPAGTYTLTVNKAGYSQFQAQGVISANAWVQQGVSLVP
jgi:prepilin-type N-terminal cleavage/methylation domain-containing protein